VSALSALAERFAGVREPAPPGELRLRVDGAGFDAAARALREAGARFVTVLAAGTAEPALVGAFALGGELVLLCVPGAAGEPVAYPSLSAWWPAARWAEQELAERGAAEPLGLAAERPLTAPDADRLDRRVEGLDVFVIPYGPVRSGIFESIQFQIETGGEDVPRIEVRPFFKHRGIEERFRGLAPEAAASVAERVAGIAGVAHAIAFAGAVERALGVVPPPAAECWRVVHAELERIACHLDVIAKQADTTALYVGTARFQILKERVMRLRAQLSGSRFGRGVVVPGGVRVEGQPDLDAIAGELDALEGALARDRRLFLGTASMTDRLIGSGRLERSLVEDRGAVGPLARGSGLSIDARHERPYGHYRRLGMRVVTRRGGDAMARVEVRFGELRESLHLLRQTLEHLRRADRGALAADLPAAGSGAAFGWAEAPQGEIATWVELRDGRIARVHIASPSLRNWALFEHAFPKDVLTDFAFIEHSFGLTAAGADR